MSQMKDDGQYHDDIARESSELIKAMNVDEWVAVFYEANWYPGIVQNVINFFNFFICL